MRHLFQLGVFFSWNVTRWAIYYNMIKQISKVIRDVTTEESLSVVLTPPPPNEILKVSIVFTILVLKIHTEMRFWRVVSKLYKHFVPLLQTWPNYAIESFIISPYVSWFLSRLACVLETTVVEVGRYTAGWHHPLFKKSLFILLIYCI